MVLTFSKIYTMYMDIIPLIELWNLEKGKYTLHAIASWTLFMHVLCHSHVENFMKGSVWSWKNERFDKLDFFSFWFADQKSFKMLPATIYFLDF